MNDDTADRIKEHFKGSSTFTKKEIVSFFTDKGISPTDNAIRKKIMVLRNAGIILTVKRGIYCLAGKTLFSPNPDATLRKLSKMFIKQFPELAYCTWSTEYLHYYMLHQPFNFYYIFETEKEALESTFYFLRNNKINVFLDPDSATIEKYTVGGKKAILLKPLVSRSPLTKYDNIVSPSVEKILVDVYCDSATFYMYHGEELENIFSKIFSAHTIDYSKLLNYADRRKHKEKITGYLKANIKNIHSDLLV